MSGDQRNRRDWHVEGFSKEAHQFGIRFALGGRRMHIHLHAAVVQNGNGFRRARTRAGANRDRHASFRRKPPDVCLEHGASILRLMSHPQPELNPPPHTYAVRVGIGVLVFDEEGRLLLHKRKGKHGEGNWSTAGGHMEFGETPEDCAVREVKEEVDIDIANPRFVGITNDVFPENGRHYVTVWMRGEWVNGEAKVADPHEVEQVGWFPLDALPSPLFTPVRNLLAGHAYRSEENPL